jgi:hypothetical protein
VASLDGPFPSPAAIAAIAAAYLLLSGNGAPAAPARVSRWRLAGRLPEAGPTALRTAARAASRWSAAGRVDG